MKGPLQHPKQVVAAILALTSLAAVIAAGVLLTCTSIPEGNDKSFNIVLMALIGYAGTGIGFYLGTSMSSANKSYLMASTTMPPSPGPPDPRRDKELIAYHRFIDGLTADERAIVLDMIEDFPENPRQVELKIKNALAAKLEATDEPPPAIPESPGASG